MNTKDKIIEIAKYAYNWGRDNGEGRSEKNFNDFLETSTFKQIDQLLSKEPLTEEVIGTDSSGQEIIPKSDKLSIHTNRHPNTDGSSWGWIEGCTKNICWSDNSKFDYNAAWDTVQSWNNKIDTNIDTMSIIPPQQSGKDYSRLYNEIAKSEWFKTAHENGSLELPEFVEQSAQKRYTMAIEGVMGLIVSHPQFKDAFETCARIASGYEPFKQDK